MNLEVVCQTAIPVLTASSAWCLANRRYRLGFVVSLCVQPFWLYTTYKASQWGVFALSLWFVYNNMRGIRNHGKS